MALDLTSESSVSLTKLLLVLVKSEVCKECGVRMGKGITKGLKRRATVRTVPSNFIELSDMIIRDLVTCIGTKQTKKKSTR
jgi:hypothetical protein